MITGRDLPSEKKVNEALNAMASGFIALGFLVGVAIGLAGMGLIWHLVGCN